MRRRGEAITDYQTASFRGQVDNCRRCGSKIVRNVLKSLDENIEYKKCATCAWEEYTSKERRRKANGSANFYGV